MTWILVALSLIGIFLNVKMHRSCFIIWTVAYFFWMLVDWQHAIYSQAALCAVQVLLSLNGLLKWKRFFQKPAEEAEAATNRRAMRPLNSAVKRSKHADKN